LDLLDKKLIADETKKRYEDERNAGDQNNYLLIFLPWVLGKKKKDATKRIF